MEVIGWINLDDGVCRLIDICQRIVELLFIYLKWLIFVDMLGQAEDFYLLAVPLCDKCAHVFQLEGLLLVLRVEDRVLELRRHSDQLSDRKAVLRDI